MWKIRNVDVPCAGGMKINVLFGADELPRDNGNSSSPPSKQQLATLMHVYGLPDNFIKEQNQCIRQFCLEMIYKKDHSLSNKTKLFRIDEHFQISELVIPFSSSPHAHDFIFNCCCDWELARGLSLLCRNEKIIKVTEGIK